MAYIYYTYFMASLPCAMRFVSSGRLWREWGWTWNQPFRADQHHTAVSTVSPHLQTGAAPSQKWWSPEMLLKQGTKKKERKNLQPGPGDACINAAEMRSKKPYTLALVMPALIWVSFIQAVTPPSTLVPITSSRDTTQPHSNNIVFNAIPTPLPHNDCSHMDLLLLCTHVTYSSQTTVVWICPNSLSGWIHSTRGFVTASLSSMLWAIFSLSRCYSHQHQPFCQYHNHPQC